MQLVAVARGAGDLEGRDTTRVWFLGGLQFGLDLLDAPSFDGLQQQFLLLLVGESFGLLPIVPQRVGRDGSGKERDEVVLLAPGETILGPCIVVGERAFDFLRMLGLLLLMLP